MIFIYIHVYIIHTYVYRLHVHLLYLSMHTLTRSLYFSCQSSWQNWWEGWVHLASFKQNYYLYVLLKTFFQRFAWSRESEKMHKNNYIPHIVTCIDVRIWTCIWISLPFIIFISVFLSIQNLTFESRWPMAESYMRGCGHGTVSGLLIVSMVLAMMSSLDSVSWSWVEHVDWSRRFGVPFITCVFL